MGEIRKEDNMATATQEKKHKLISDKVVKKIFSSGSEASQEYLLKIVSLATGIPYEKLKKGFRLIHPNAGINANTVDSELDIAFESDEYFVSFEINQGKSDTLDVKNGSYTIILYLRQLKSSKEYKNLKPVYQVNLDDFDYFGKDRFLYFSELKERESNDPRHLDLYVIDINLDYLRNLGYNNIRNADELEKLLYLFVCSDEEQLDELYEGDKMMGSIREEANQLVSDLDLMLYYDEEDLQRQIGEERYEKGVLQKQKEVAKKMLEKSDISYIAEVTGLTIEDIEALKNETTE